MSRIHDIIRDSQESTIVKAEGIRNQSDFAGKGITEQNLIEEFAKIVLLLQTLESHIERLHVQYEQSTVALSKALALTLECNNRWHSKKSQSDREAFEDANLGVEYLKADKKKCEGELSSLEKQAKPLRRTLKAALRIIAEGLIETNDSASTNVAQRSLNREHGSSIENQSITTTQYSSGGYEVFSDVLSRENFLDEVPDTARQSVSDSVGEVNTSTARFPRTIAPVHQRCRFASELASFTVTGHDSSDTFQGNECRETFINEIIAASERPLFATIAKRSVYPKRVHLDDTVQT